jgi:hypothetical protein
MIQIDVPCRGKPDQRTTCFSRSVRIWPSTIRISCGPRIATFHESPTDLDRSHCSREKGIPDYIPGTSADRSVDPHLLLTASEAVG